MNNRNWEQGSEFHWMSWRRAGLVRSPWSGRDVSFGSGRDAMKALLLHGMSERGWKRLWTPSYFCQDVVSSLLSTGIEVKIYPDGPGTRPVVFDNPDAAAGDVLLRVNHFGIRSQVPIDESAIRGMEIIDDHSHDPWSEWAWTSGADWCVASLRKVLPVPDGGVLWSPAGHALPTGVELSREHYVASLEKLAAMLIKTMYLDGRFDDKDVFRRLAISGEQHISGGVVSGTSEWSIRVSEAFPLDEWRERRRHNHKVLSENLRGLKWLSVMQPENELGSCPFSGILVFDSKFRRAQVRERLIESRVYPAILWSLDEPVVDGIPSEHVDLSRRILSIHCDMRYDESEMKRVARLIREYGEEFEVRDVSVDSGCG